MTSTKNNLLIGTILVAFAAILKVSTFPHSINPIIAISLFSGAILKDKKLAFFMPLLAMFVSDIMLELFNIAPGFYGIGQVGNYASLLLVTALGFQSDSVLLHQLTCINNYENLIFLKENIVLANMGSLTFWSQVQKAAENP